MVFEQTTNRGLPNLQGAWGIIMRVNDIATAASVGRDASHEIGHQAGLPDYYDYRSENPFVNRVATVKTGLLTFSVGELMDNQGHFRVLSLGSLERIIAIPLNTALSQPENKITLISGSGNQPIDKTLPSSNNPSKIIDKKNE